jgi:hypothetical protein
MTERKSQDKESKIGEEIKESIRKLTLSSYKVGNQ